MIDSRTEDKQILHVVTAYFDEDGFCLGQNVVKNKNINIIRKTVQVKLYNNSSYN